jgi:hypothetical protein
MLRLRPIVYSLWCYHLCPAGGLRADPAYVVIPQAKKKSIHKTQAEWRGSAGVL